MAHLFVSKRLIYRAVEPEDDSFLTLLQTDYTAAINSSWNLPRPESKQTVESFRKNLTDVALLAVLICLPSTDKNSKPIPIGQLHFAPTKPSMAHHRNTEVGIDILASYRGQGYGSEAIEWALRWAFKSAGFHRIGIESFSYNEAANRLYQKLGFVEEGRKRECLWYDGGWHDELHLGMLEHEWREKYDA